MRRYILTFLRLLPIAATPFAANAQQIHTETWGDGVERSLVSSDYIRTPKLKPIPRNIYETPYSITWKFYDWKRLWINTATLCRAFLWSLIVLECLPDIVAEGYTLGGHPCWEI